MLTQQGNGSYRCSIQKKNYIKLRAYYESEDAMGGLHQNRDSCFLPYIRDEIPIHSGTASPGEIRHLPGGI